MLLMIGVFICLLAAIGLVQAMGWLVFSLRPASGLRCLKVIPLCSDPNMLEARLRHELRRLRWSTSPRRLTTVLLDMGLEEKALEVCQHMLQGTGFSLCTADELLAEIRCKGYIIQG